MRRWFNGGGFVSWMAGDVNTLRVILLYHFSNGIFINGGLEGGVTNMLKTLQGKNLRVFSVRIPTHFDSFVLRNRKLQIEGQIILLRPKTVKISQCI